MGGRSIAGRRRLRGAAPRLGGARRTMTAAWLGVVAALALVTVAVIAPGQPVLAAVNQVYSTDEDGSGEVTHYTTADAIYGYVETGTIGGGGYVCATAPASDVCVAAKLPVPAFVRGPVPLYRPGELPAQKTYRLIGFSQNGLTVSARQLDTFTVGAGNCNAPAPDATVLDETVCAANLAAFKEAAGRMAGHSALVMVLGGAAAVGTAFIGGAFVLTSFGGGISFIGLGIGLGGLGIAAWSYGVASNARDAYEWFSQIETDPPDPAFATVAPPIFTTAAPPDDPIDRAYFVASDRQAAYAEAVLHAYERFQGAQLAGDGAAAKRQIAATAEYSTGLAGSMRDTADALRQIAARTAGVGGDTNALLDEGYLANVAAIQQRVESDGFTSAELDQLAALGAGPTDVDAARAAFSALDMSVIAPGGTVAEHVEDLAAAVDAEVPAVEAFAADAAGLAQLPAGGDAPPTASFTATPTSGPVPLAVLFDVSASTDPESLPLAYSWDFGDGTGGTGATANHEYTSAGTYTVTLTVTDAGGHVAQAVQPVVVLPRTDLPVASFTVRPPVGIVPVAASFDASGSSDDGSIESYAWDFGDGSTGAGAVVPHEFTGDGPFVVQLTVTDDDGNTATASQPLNYRAQSSLDVPVCGDQGDGTAVLRCADFTRTPGVELWHVAGNGAVDVTFDWVYRNAGNANQLSAFVVDDDDSAIDGTAPGEPGYAAKAVSPGADGLREWVRCEHSGHDVPVHGWPAHRLLHLDHVERDARLVAGPGRLDALQPGGRQRRWHPVRPGVRQAGRADAVLVRGPLGRW